MIIGGFPGFGCGDGADHFSSSEVWRICLCRCLVRRRHTDDVVEETWGGPETIDVVQQDGSHKMQVYMV